ncbi:MAG: winged helix-turn-helix domain-containing protein [Rickettsiales bacterium]|nr:winged helix-turn-helix domain-containing protein [Pseudomonadota bacterium]MDA0966299.1 winged helix-turn-helix domain-containing protein [Pseudomonadota bacterium]MDG4543036.1 winged helix-turn-helix domain-containing protein [Rickettsiales bacterium]MDG4545234.1 winged helix-turn-helix domain-containing protein [Rickettsiales bacterium]MDG4547683.1 winged helix-turn-helix domain-containing protein [Rickettsiales bacterium]
MQVSVITKKDDFFDLLSGYSSLNSELFFIKYDSLAEYLQNKPVNDITVVASDIGESDYKNENCIFVGKDIELPYKLNSLFAIVENLILGYKYKIQDFIFNFKGNELINGGDKIDLTDTESKILVSLINAYPDIIDKKKLLELVFGYSGDVDTHTLETHIYRLRKKIDIGNDIIITDKTGYKIALK